MASLPGERGHPAGPAKIGGIVGAVDKRIADKTQTQIVSLHALNSALEAQ